MCPQGVMPFTDTQFLDLFGAFNTALWPVLVALWLATLAVAIQLVRGRARSDVVWILASVHWAWSGIAYHAVFFTRINPAAWVFAAGFVMQAIGFMWWAVRRGRSAFVWQHTLRCHAAAVFLGYALLYPGLVVLAGHTLPRAPAFGVPCPTALFTAGLLFAATPRVPWGLLVVPILWAVIGGSAALLFAMTPDLMLFVAGATLLFHIRESRSVRATDEERRRRLPGDELIRAPIATITHAITISRPPADVWPWLVQMGADRAGWYSYDWIDNGRQPSASHVVAALQELHIGSLMPALPGETKGFTVLSIDPERSLVVGWLLPSGTPMMTWAFTLDPGRMSTRLVVRVRGGPEYRFRNLPTWAAPLVVRPVHFVMQRKQLVEIARRAESVA